MSINLVITSGATVDMYVFVPVEMPSYDGAGLYDLNSSSGWSLVETSEIHGKYVAVYRYDSALTPVAFTSALSSSWIMADMSMADKNKHDVHSPSHRGFKIIIDTDSQYLNNRGLR